MSTPIEDNRWASPAEQFATQIQVADVAGFFSKKLVVEPGTRALLIEEGQYLGEVPPGTYTLESFCERLRPWRRKQATVVLTRQEEVPLTITAADIPTAENLLVAVALRLTVQMEDVAMFLRNLLGAAAQFSTADLLAAIEPVVRQALWEAVGRMGIAELTGAQVRPNIEAAVAQALGVSMRRYGLRFGQVQTVSIRHDQYDEQRRKRGEVFLMKEGIQQQRALDEVYTEEELRKVRLQEKTNELTILGHQVAADLMEGELAVKIRRIGIRNKLRAAVLSEQFDQIRNEQELAAMIHQQDSDRLLRENEKDELVALYRDKKEDRESARRHLVNKLDLERSMELESLRSDLDYAAKTKTLEHEMALARRVEDEDNRRWLETLKKESELATHRRQEKDAEIEHQRRWGMQFALDRREEEWQELLHQQRTDRLAGDVEVARTERQMRVERMKLEFQAVRDKDALAFRQQEAAVKKEIDDATFDSQLKKLEALDRLDRETTRFQAEMAERQRRVDSEMKMLEDDKASQRELARIREVKGLSVEALMATAGPDIARVLAEVEKHRASEETKRTAGAEVEKVRAEAQSQQAQMMERLAAAAEDKAAALLQAMKDAMAVQQQTTQQAFQAMGQMGQGAHPQVTVVPGVGGQPLVVGQTPGMVPHAALDPAARRVVVCAQCRTENDEKARFCSNCGNKL